MTSFDLFVERGGKRLRCGYTTGTCAACAASAALTRLLDGVWPARVAVRTPKGVTVEVDVEACAVSGEPGETPWSDVLWASCAVRKDGGDDVDATHGALVFVRASLCAEPGVRVVAGEGVGTVTLPGLDQPVGAPAVNSVPRAMLEQVARERLGDAGCDLGVELRISVSEGEAIALKTFNPQLGIVGGISILGTSGIVEPMSTAAIVETCALELRQASALGKSAVMLVPGNYGEAFVDSQGLLGSLDPADPDCPLALVKCSNFIGDAVDEARACGFKSILLVGHAGKLVKLAGGIMNTHSSCADCRAELICAHAAVCGAPREACERVMGSATADAAFDVLDGYGLLEATVGSLLGAIGSQLERRAGSGTAIGALMYTNARGELGRTAGWDAAAAALPSG